MGLIDGLSELSEALSENTDISSFIIFANENNKHVKALHAIYGKSHELLIAYAEIGIQLAEQMEWLSLDEISVFINEYAKRKKKEE